MSISTVLPTIFPTVLQNIISQYAGDVCPSCTRVTDCYNYSFGRNRATLCDRCSKILMSRYIDSHRKSLNDACA